MTPKFLLAAWDGATCTGRPSHLPPLRPQHSGSTSFEAKHQVDGRLARHLKGGERLSILFARTAGYSPPLSTGTLTARPV